VVDLSVCIVNWNTRDDLARCLASLQHGQGDLEYEVWVVDNGSTDGSVERVQTQFPTVHLLRNAANVGFSAANNQALRACRGRYALLLNPDTLVHDGALGRLVGFLDRHPEAGVVGVKLLNPDGSVQYSCRTFPTLGAVLFRGTPFGRLFPRNRSTRDYLMQDWQHEEVRTVDWVSGAGLAVRRSVWEQVGLLDERFFMYCEDMDFCQRVHQAGWRVYYFPGAVVTHVIGRSSDQNLRAMILAFHRSMYLYYDKHYGARYGLVGRLAAGAWLLFRATSILLRNFVGRTMHF
jgi:GT2 family glycosyltransferase